MEEEEEEEVSSPSIQDNVRETLNSKLYLTAKNAPLLKVGQRKPTGPLKATTNGNTNGNVRGAGTEAVGGNGNSTSSFRVDSLLPQELKISRHDNKNGRNNGVLNGSDAEDAMSSRGSHREHGKADNGADVTGKIVSFDFQGLDNVDSKSTLLERGDKFRLLASEIESTTDSDTKQKPRKVLTQDEARDLLRLMKRLSRNPESQEFVYLRPYLPDEKLPPAERFTPLNPYHLEVVQHSEINPDNYFTMSAHGVTQFLQGKPSFTELGRWRKEFQIFMAIRKINVFRKYRVWKSYKVWKDVVHYGKMHIHQGLLTKNLFWMDDKFRNAILEIRLNCEELKTGNLHSFQPSHLYRLEEFYSDQQSQRETFLKQLLIFWDTNVSCAAKACTSTLDALEAKLLGSAQNVGPQQGAIQKVTGIQKDDSQNYRYTIKASKRVEHQRLYHLLRLCDYVIFNSLYSIVIGTLDFLLEKFAPKVTPSITFSDGKSDGFDRYASTGRPGSDGLSFEMVRSGSFMNRSTEEEVDEIQSIFVTEVIMEKDKLVFVPSVEDFEDQIDAIIDDYVATVSSKVRLLGHEELIEYTSLYDPDSDISDSASVADIILNDDGFQKRVQQLRKTITSSFEKAEKCRLSLEPYREMAMQNLEVDSEELKQKYESGEIALNGFKTQLVLYKGQIDDVKKLDDWEDFGILRVDTRKLKDALAPAPAEALSKVESLLPELALEKQKVIMERVGGANARLSKKPASVADFVSLLAFVETEMEAKEELEAQFADLQKHYELMESQEVFIPDMIKAEYALLVPEYAQMQTSLEMAESTREEDVAHWNSVLDKEIKEFGERIKDMKIQAENPQILEDSANPEIILEVADGLREQVRELESWAKEAQRFQGVFGANMVRYPELDDLVSDVQLKKSMWEAMVEVSTITEQWKEKLLEELNIKELETIVQKWFKAASRAERELPANPVAPKLKSLVQVYKDLVPSCSDLRNPALQPRHWEKIDGVVGRHIERDPELWEEPLTLGLLLSYGVMDHQEQIQKISTEATQEGVLESMLGKLQEQWRNAEFTLNSFKESKDVFILGGVDEIQALLDESMVTIGTIMASRYVGGIRPEVEKMETNVRMMQDTLDEWLGVQKNWMYLEPIFSAPDIQRQLPLEAKQFLDIDKGFKGIMKKTNENPNCMRAGTQPGLADHFKKWNEALDKIQKSLEEYLEFKRMAFPRFYFLSNDELLEILAQTRNVQAVQPHMMKCFDAIKKLDFGGEHESSPVRTKDETSVDIYGMISSEGEYVTLGKNLKARGEVEHWLSSVEKAMVTQLRILCKEALDDYEGRDRHQWVFDHAGQLLINVSQITWARGAESALDGELVPGDPRKGISTWFDQNVVWLSELCRLVRGDLTKLQRGSLVALITIDVHNRDIIEYLINDGTTSKTDFSWQMRIRYYWNPSVGTFGDLEIFQVTARFLCAYEYLGASFRLVITPLSDRCYMTLTGALELKLGGAPAGPAGTGKTETTKDLAKALSRQCVVFNCGDNLDYKFMGKFFKGLAQCGAWACFDEFNRINVEVLSVVAQQIITIQIALRQQVTEFEFEGLTIKLVDTFGVFITMNPGYAGRTELPDNLKALFRPMSMMVPDYSLIAEISLFAEGFETSRPLSKKMTKLYKLASEQVSSQPHYDFGMRAVKSVLVMAGAGKRANPDLPENITLIRAMCDSNIPKFLKDDVILFNAIVEDLFPGVEVPKQDTGDLYARIVHCLQSQSFVVNDDVMTKAIQLYEVLGIRFGVMVVGPTGGGKTTLSRALAEAMTQLRNAGHADSAFQVTHTYCFNPKSISMGELYGNYNLLTNEWTDGLGSTIIRTANSDTSEDRKYIVFDGPIDAIWIENMNTVLDDNRTLCLPNGERIKLNGNTLRMLFEVEDCAVASPATVSRLGVVWVPPEGLGCLAFIQMWVEVYLPVKLPKDLKSLIASLLEEHVPNAILTVRRDCREGGILSMDNNLATSLCRMLQTVFLPARKFIDSPNGEDLDFEMPGLADLLKRWFLFSLVWSIGGNLDADSKEIFSEWVRDSLSSVARFPNSGNVYDYCVDPESKEFRPWEEVAPKFVYHKDKPYSDILVPTKDTVRYSYMLEAFISVGRGSLFVGESGTGKSVIVVDALYSLAVPGKFLGREVEGNLIPFTINFSAQTSSPRTQEMLELRFEKKRKGVVGAPVNKKLICFVDDVNMPAREEYGAQPPIELLRQVTDTLEYYRPLGGLYDRKKFNWNDIVDMVLVAACGPPGGGRNVVTNRFFRHFSMLSISPPSRSVLFVIFFSILDGHLTMFPSDVKALAKTTVDASIDIYERISSEMLPTPAKSHYTFNLRDLSKVFQGILSLKVQHCPDSRTFLRLWCHENQRVFQDRLIDHQDKILFQRWLHEMLKKKFSVDWDYAETFEKLPILFGDFLKMGVAPEDRHYEPIQDPKKLDKLMEAYLEEYNLSTPKTMNLVFFMDAIEHISRLARILRSPRGNAMLVGLGGSGKQSLTRLAAFMSDYKCISIELTRGYGNNEFREDIKKLFMVAGVERNPVVFLFTDSQIVNEGFVEDINSILNAGDVPNLFPPDEKDRIINDVREYAAALGRPLSKDSVYQTFISCVQANLHCVLCMSPVGEAFRTRCRMFPSLINCTTIDWYLPWPQEALLDVAKRFLLGLENVDLEVKGALCTMCTVIHQSVETSSDRFWEELRRKFYISPKSYLDLIEMYLKLLGEKRSELSEKRDRFKNGLDKMVEVGLVIEQSKKDLAELAPILVEKSKATEELLAVVTKDKASAAEVETVVAAETLEVEAQATEVKMVQEDAQKDLDEALPALDAAVTALNSLTKGDITEVKSFAKPPALVQTTMEAVCALLGMKTDWDTAKRVLGQSDFMDLLLNYDKDNMDPKRVKVLTKYTAMPDFTPETVGKVSKAAKGLCMWCRAMEVYNRVAKEVEPKKAKLAAANATLAKAMAALKEKQDALKEVQDKVASLEEQLDQAMVDKKSLADQAALCEARLGRAGKLTDALGSEQVSWTEQVGQLNEQLKLLVGDVFLGAACVAYYGPLTGGYRKEIVAQWTESCKSSGIPVSPSFSLVNTLSKAVEVREWNINGLPTDEVSIDNGVLVKTGQRWPLMIDPQMQANRWIKNMEERNGLRLIKLTDPNFLRTLESSIRVGNPVLLEDLGEELDPALEPILLKQLFKQGSRILIRVGEQDVDYDPAFKFYMTTKMSNPHYLPDVCIKATLINFVITLDGLEDQLLGDVVRKERPDLEAMKDKLVVSMASDKKQLSDLQDKVLKLLKESEGMILDNEPLINTLQQSKFTTSMIVKRVADATETDEQISTAREGYRSVATRGSLIYFVVADLAEIDPMYQYSLEYFKRLYNYCIEVSEKNEDLDKRLEILIAFITDFMYKNVCRGLFEKHKLIFSFLICSSIQRNLGNITTAEWNFILRGAPPAEAKVKNPDPTFVSSPQWEAVLGLEAQMPHLFEGFVGSVTDSVKLWKQWAGTAMPQDAPLPEPWQGQLNSFQKMIVLKIFREEKLVFATSKYVEEKMGRSFTESPPIMLAEIYPDTDYRTPVIFVLSVGSDPTGALIKFAEEKNYLSRLQSISLGQGQGPVAEKVIAQSTKKGDWVCLMNCHLATSWMGALEKIVEEFAHGVGDENFRLWLTSMPSKSFPVSVLQNGIKLTNEPPKGLRANLIGTFTMLAEEWEVCGNDRGGRDGRYWKKLLVGLAFFHAVVQERRKYGALGWNIRYEFNTSDILCAKDVLKMFTRNFEEMPWEALTYVTGHVNYGGRVTDDIDRRCLMCILARYYTKNVVDDDEYKFSESGTYFSPKVGSHDTLMDYLRSLPMIDNPEVFGMHANANITFQLQETRSIFETVLSIQPRVSGGHGEGKSPEELVDEMCNSTLSSLPPDFSHDSPGFSAQDHAPGLFTKLPNGAYRSLDTVLLQELDKFNRLIRAMRISLADLQKAIKGVVVMSAELEMMFTSFQNNQVPSLWSKVAYPSLKPLGSWLKDFHRRINFFKSWLVKGQPNSFWLPGFYYPQGFMTGALQTHARRYQLPIDTLNFGFTVKSMEGVDDVADAPEDGIYVEGLFLEAARWDRRTKKLKPSNMGEMMSLVPIIHFNPVQDYTPPPEDYECPLYKTNVRAGVLNTTGQSTNYILSISLPTDEPPDIWVLMGTAMVTMTND